MFKRSFQHLLFTLALVVLTFLVALPEPVAVHGQEPPKFEPPALTRQSTDTPLWYPNALLPQQFDWRDYASIGVIEDMSRANPTDPNFPGSNLTPAKNQNPCGSCYAFGALGSVESFLGRKALGELDLSENNVKNCNADKQANPGKCGESGNFSMIANYLNLKGTVFEQDDPYVAMSSPTTCNTTVTYRHTLLSWLKVGEQGKQTDAATLKNYLVNYGPLEISIKADNEGPTGQRFMDYRGAEVTKNPVYMPLTAADRTDHSVLLVGWNDNTPHEGGKGVWIIKNSWGTGWGKNGLAEVAYGSANLALGPISVPTDFQPYNSTGGILAYDTFGDSKSTTMSSAKHKMVKFTPTQNSCVDRVEIKLTGAASNIKVSLYDSLKPGKNSWGDNVLLPADLLKTIADKSWPAGGSISIPVDGTVRLTANDDVFVTVTVPDGFLLGGDLRVSSERSYESYDGQGWKQGDDGALYIRLRTKVCDPNAPTDPTPTLTPFVPTATPTPLPSSTPTATPLPGQPAPTAAAPVATVASVCNVLPSGKADMNAQAVAAPPLPLAPAPFQFKRFAPSQTELRQAAQAHARQQAITREPRQVEPTPEYATGLQPEEEAINITGTVQLPDGSAAPWAQVTAYQMDTHGQRFEAGSSAFTDEQGLFHFYLTPGEYELDILPSYQDVQGNPQLGMTRLLGHSLTMGTTPMTLDPLKLPAATKTIKGQVVQSTGAGVADVDLLLFNEETGEFIIANPATDGTFTLPVGGGSWDVEVLPHTTSSFVPTHGAMSVEFAADETVESDTVTLTVTTATAQVTGQLVDNLGNALTNAEGALFVTLVNQETAALIDRTVQADGHFSLPAVDGLYQASIWLDDAVYPQFSAPLLTELVEVTGNKSLGQLKLLANNALIQGEITNSDGQPVEGIFVDAYQNEGQLKQSVTDHAGHYEFRLPAGEWYLLPSPAEEEAYLYAGEAKSVVASSSQATTANFSLEPVQNWLTGEVTDQQNELASDIEAFVYLRRENEVNPIVMAPVEHGRFYIKKPFGKLKLGLYLSNESNYTLANEVSLNRSHHLNPTEALMAAMAANEQEVDNSRSIDSFVVGNSAPTFIAGQITDLKGTPLTSLRGKILATTATMVNGSGSNSVRTAKLTDSQYRVETPYKNVQWILSYKPDEGEADYALLNNKYLISTTEGQTTTENLTLVKLEGVVQGTVVNSAGAPQRFIQIQISMEGYRTNANTNFAGKFSVKVPQLDKPATITIGTAVKSCAVGAALSNCKIDAPTQSSIFDPSLPRSLRDIKLVLRGANSYLIGQVINSFQNNAPVANASVSGANSVGGQSINTTTDSNGCFAVPITKTDTYQWQLQAKYGLKIGNATYNMTANYGLSGSSYQSRLQRDSVAVNQALSTGAVLALDNHGVLPESKTATFEVSQGWQYTLSDGTTIEIPANVVSTKQKQLQVVLKPTVAVPLSYRYTPLNYGLELALYEPTGKAVTSPLERLVEITFRPGYSGTLVAGQLSNEVWHTDLTFIQAPDNSGVTLMTQRTGTFALLTINALSTAGGNTYLPLIVK